MLPVYSSENARKPFPLYSNKTLEASTTVKQRSIEVEDHRLNISQHQAYSFDICLTTSAEPRRAGADGSSAGQAAQCARY